MTGEEDQLNLVLKVLTEHFDKLKVEKDNFEHLGLRHVLEPNGSRSVSQEHYVNELRFIAETNTQRMNQLMMISKVSSCHFLVE